MVDPVSVRSSNCPKLRSILNERKRVEGYMKPNVKHAVKAIKSGGTDSRVGAKMKERERVLKATNPKLKGDSRGNGTKDVPRIKRDTVNKENVFKGKLQGKHHSDATGNKRNRPYDSDNAQSSERGRMGNSRSERYGGNGYQSYGVNASHENVNGFGSYGNQGGFNGPGFYDCSGNFNDSDFFGERNVSRYGNGNSWY